MLVPGSTGFNSLLQLLTGNTVTASMRVSTHS